jgi:tRNA(adenine34) deaminase
LILPILADLNTPTQAPATGFANPEDQAFMHIALQLAAEAAAAGEVPVGAVVVRNGQVIGTGRNSPIHSRDPCAHAEINALRAAASALGNYRLEECTLYVTLEPCAMCCGAMLHSRLKRVVFGAAEPKTGCAGSVLNLFAQAPLNHQTTVEGGLLAQPASRLLQQFFRDKRSLQRAQAIPLREDALRTPERCFDALTDYPWPAHYVSDLPSLDGLRLHYLDMGAADSPQVFLCLHPIPGWSYSCRALVASLVEQGARVVAPDLMGFGKSDKPKREIFHALDWHLRCLRELIAWLDLRNIVLLVPDAAHPLAQGLSSDSQCRVKAMVVQACASSDGAGRDAPYPDAGHRAGERALAGRRK